MPSFNTFDLAGTMMNAERYKSAVAARESAEAAAAQRQEIGQLAPAAMEGDTAAMNRIVALDPKEAEVIMKLANSRDEARRKKAQEGIETTGKILAAIQQSDDPAKMYERARNFVPEEFQKVMPEEYNGDWVDLQMARAMDMDKIMSNPTKVTFGDQDLLFRHGKQVGSTTSSAERTRQNQMAMRRMADATSRGNALIRAAGSGGSGGGQNTLASADENAMFRYAASQFGGFVSPITGEITGLDDQSAQQALAVGARAAEIYQGGGTTRQGAVAQAAREMGIEIPALGGGQPDLGIDQLLQQYGGQ